MSSGKMYLIDKMYFCASIHKFHLYHLSLGYHINGDARNHGDTGTGTWMGPQLCKLLFYHWASGIMYLAKAN